MTVPRFIENFSPEKEWSSLPLAKDGIGDQFLPLSPELQNPLPVSQDWPGEGVAAHVMITSGRRSIDDQLKQVFDEGLVAPRRYAILSTRAEMGWGRETRYGSLGMSHPISMDGRIHPCWQDRISPLRRGNDRTKH